MLWTLGSILGMEKRTYEWNGMESNGKRQIWKPKNNMRNTHSEEEHGERRINASTQRTETEKCVGTVPKLSISSLLLCAFEFARRILLILCMGMCAESGKYSWPVTFMHMTIILLCLLTASKHLRTRTHTLAERERRIRKNSEAKNDWNGDSERDSHKHTHIHIRVWVSQNANPIAHFTQLIHTHIWHIHCNCFVAL